MASERDNPASAAACTALNDPEGAAVKIGGVGELGRHVLGVRLKELHELRLVPLG